jgi:uncharacterized membrane protein (DUF485 family)
MSADQRLLVIGLYINSALYLSGVYWAGLIYHNNFAWKMALASAGMSYVAYLLQLALAPRWLLIAAVTASISVGTIAGTALLPS